MKNIPYFTGTITKGKIKLHNRDLFDIYVGSLPDGDIKMTVSQKHRTRSTPQNAYYWGVVIPILCNEIGYTHEELHEALKWKFLRKHLEMSEEQKSKFINEESLEKLPTVRSTATLTTVEYEEYLEQIKQWAAIDLNIVIPNPNDVANPYEFLTNQP